VNYNVLPSTSMSGKQVESSDRSGLIFFLYLGKMLSTALRLFQLRLPTRTRPPYFPRSHSCRVLSTMGAIGAQTVNTTDRLAALRRLMAEHNVDTYVVPSEDQRERSGSIRSRINTDVFVFADSSEYPAECDKRRAFISGFNGSAGSFLSGPNISLLIMILCRHCDRDKGPGVSFYGWTLLSSGGATAR